MKGSQIILPLAMAALLGTGFTAVAQDSESSTINVPSTGRYPDFTEVAEQSINTVVHVMTKSMPKTTSSSNVPGSDDDMFNFFSVNVVGFSKFSHSRVWLQVRELYWRAMAI